MISISREVERRFVDSTFPHKKPKSLGSALCPSHLDPQGELLSRTNEQGWRVNAREGEREGERTACVRTPKEPEKNHTSDSFPQIEKKV